MTINIHCLEIDFQYYLDSTHMEFLTFAHETIKMNCHFLFNHLAVKHVKGSAIIKLLIIRYMVSPPILSTRQHSLLPLSPF